MLGTSNKILLHACCAICAGYPIELLKSLGFEPIVFFSNDNIDTLTEFDIRKEALVFLCNNLGVDYIIDDYEHGVYLQRILGQENEPEKGLRCETCINLRLEKTAKKAVELNLKNFTTTLTISPHKEFEKISNIGLSLAKEYDLEYQGFNFKKQDGFLKTNKIANALNLYRQNYCGCEFAKAHLLKEG